MRVVLPMLLGLLAVGAASCKSGNSGPTCCQCYAVGYELGEQCLWTGQLIWDEGFDDCTAACEDAAPRQCDTSVSGTECAPATAAPKSPLTELEEWCAAGHATVCGWSVEDVSALSKTGTCNGDPVWLRTCVVGDTIRLYDTACVASAPLGADGAFSGATCSEGGGSASASRTTVTFSGTITGLTLTATRDYRHDIAASDSTAASTCDEADAVTYRIGDCR